jgi:hypothetical protein
MKRYLVAAFGFVALAGVVLVARPLVASDEPDELMPGKVTVIKGPGILAKFVAKPAPATTFALPAAFNDPTVEGGTLAMFDTLSGAGGDTYALPAAGWKGLGNPPGASGFKFSGVLVPGNSCRVVLIKKTVVKGVCRGTGVTLSPPFAGDVGIILTAGTDSKRYCATFGGSTVINSPGKVIRKNSPAVACPTTTTTTTTSTTTTTIDCCGAERITFTTTAGTLRVDNIVTIPFPGGVVLTLDTTAATVGLPECRHDVIVPAGGLSIPSFDFPGTGFCTSFTSLGCESGGADGKGSLWDGAGSAGLALTNVTKQADTSDGVCNPPGQICNTGGAGSNTLGKIVTTRSASSSSGIRTEVGARIREITWLDSVCNSAETPGCCTTSAYNPGDGDLLIFQYDAILGLTTDVATGAFVDMNADTCKRAGVGFDSAAPGADGPKSKTGSPAAGPCCTAGQGASLAAVGETFSGSPPFFDLGFQLTMPATVSSCGVPAGGSCVLTTDACLGSPSGAFLDGE